MRNQKISEQNASDGADYFEDSDSALNRNYGLILDIIPEVIYEFVTTDNPYHRTMCFITPKVREFTGINRDEFLANPQLWFESIHADDSARVKKATRKILTEKQRTNLEYRIYNRLEDNYRWITDTLVPQFDGSGNVISILCVARDITNSRQSDNFLRQLNTAINHTCEAIFMTDLEGYINYVNPAFKSITGYSSSEVVGKIPQLLQNGNHDTSFPTSLWQQLLSGNSWRGHTTNKKKDGTVYEEITTISPVLDTMGEVKGFIGIFRDVTRERELETQLYRYQKMEVVGRLAAGLAHDFNNLLTRVNLIVGQMQIQLEGGNPVQVLANDILKIVDAGSKQIRQLLQLGPDTEISSAVIDLNSEVLETKNLLTKLIGRDVQMLTDISTEEAMVRANPDHLQQILLNLVSNAADAMPDGGQISLKTYFTLLEKNESEINSNLAPGPYIQLEVKDTGSGIEQNVLEHIFEPFYSTKSSAKGTGLGLTTVYGLVQKLGGDIQVHSSVGNGTTFTVILPLVNEQHEIPYLPAHK